LDSALPKKVWGGPIADRLKTLLGEIASQYGIEILSMEVMPHHICTGGCACCKCRSVHLFVSAPPKFSPAEVERYFWRTVGSHGTTSGRLKQEFAYLRRPRRGYWGEHATLCAEDYSVGTAGHTCPGGRCQGVSAETIKHSIEHSQKA